MQCCCMHVAADLSQVTCYLRWCNTCMSALCSCMYRVNMAAGSATVKVYYYGWWVLTATGTICEAPTASSQEPGSTSSSSSLSTAHRRTLLSSTALSKSWSSQTWLSRSPGGAAGMQVAASTPHSASSSAAHRAWPGWQEDTCVLPQGPLQLHHQANLPSVAPRGNYRMQLSATDANDGMELFCLDVWFKVAS